MNFAALLSARLRLRVPMGNWKTSNLSCVHRRLRIEHLEERRLLANVPAGFTETVLAANLTSPTTLDIEESGRIWVAYQDGRIEVVEEGTPGTTFAFQLDADGSGEHGLQGIELDPDFENNNYIYVYYTANSPEPHNRLSRLTVDPTTENTILAGSELVLLDLPNLSDYGNPPWHIGGAIHFRFDGTIFVQVGESQQAALSQDLDSPLGKILRVNADGSIPTDNPFYDASDGLSWRDRIWASGLRNPFAGDLDPVTGKYFVADVGAGSWEEVNDATLPGLNFGWPTTEGNFDPGTFPNFTEPVHAYSHSNGCAITGGAFNNGGTNAFPAEFQGHFFFSEFCGGEIRVLDPNNPGDVEVFATNAAFPMNIEFGPDGSLYYIARGAGAGGAPGTGTGSVRKIAFAADVAPSIVVHPNDQLVSAGYDASFTVSAAGTTPLSYQWQVSSGGNFTNIAGATSATLDVSAVLLSDTGNQYRVVVANSLGSATSDAANLTVTVDTPPTPFFFTPTIGSSYRAGDLISFAGGATDLEDGVLSASDLTWQVDFHHNTHSHPFIAPTSGIASGQFTVPVVTETDDDVWYRITLTAADSAGLSTTIHRDVFPEKSNFAVGTNLPDAGGDLVIDGRALQGPYFDTGVENVLRTISASPLQDVNGDSVFFEQWLDGTTSLERTISTPTDDRAYVALYRSFADQPVVYMSDLTPAENPINGWGPIEPDASNGEDAGGDGNPIRINGVTYEKGLGVHAESEITYNLAGAYGRFLSDIGLDDEITGGSVVFRVIADGLEIFNSGLMNSGSATQTVDVDVSGVNELKLIVNDGGNGIGADHADWADARLLPLQSEPLVNVNFQLAGASTPAGYLADTGQTYADRGNGWDYGWSSDHTDLSRDRDLNPDQRLDTLVHFHAGQMWEIDVANGNYVVTVSIGDAGFPSTHTLNVEGQNYWQNELLTAGNFASRTQQVVVVDGRLTLDMGTAPERATRINYIEIATTADTGTLLPFAAADVTLDGSLDLNDVLAFSAGWGIDGSSLTLEQRVRQGDLDFDGDTDADDWDLFHNRWLHENNAPLSFDGVLAPIDGDYNYSGAVTRADLTVWEQSYGSDDYLAADANGNSIVDGLDFLEWQRNFGSSNQQPPVLDALTLYVNPLTGEGTLRNETGTTIELIGYSIVSTEASLLPGDSSWNSFADQGLSGWQEATPSATVLSELNAFGSLTFGPQESRSLGHFVDLSSSTFGYSLEYADGSLTGPKQGFVAIAELPQLSPLQLSATAIGIENNPQEPTPDIQPIETILSHILIYPGRLRLVWGIIDTGAKSIAVVRQSSLTVMQHAQANTIDINEAALHQSFSDVEDWISLPLTPWKEEGDGDSGFHSEYFDLAFNDIEPNRVWHGNNLRSSFEA